MKTMFCKLGTVLALVMVAVGCTAAPTKLPTSAPTEPPYTSEKTACPCAGDTDTQTFINLKHAEEEAARTKNIDIIKSIYFDNATIRNVEQDKSWSTVVEAYQEGFKEADFIKIETTDLQVLKNAGNKAWVVTHDSGVLVDVNTNERIEWQDGIAHLIFEKNSSGCWLISHFSISASSEPFPIDSEPSTALQKPLVPVPLTSDQLLAQISVGREPFRLAIGEGAIWVTDQHDAAVYRIDPQTNEIVAAITLPGAPKGLAVGAGAIWVANQIGLARIDAQTNQVVTTIEVGRGLNVAVGAGSVWVTSTSGIVSRIDPETNQVIASITIEGVPSGIAFRKDAVWVANKESTVVSRIDPQTNQVVASIDAGFSTLALAADQESVWVAAESDSKLLRIDPQTNQIVARIAVGVSPWGIAADKHAVWVTSNSDKTLWRIDPHTNQVVAAYKVGLGPLGVAIGEGDLWVATSFDQTVWRIKP
jgi:virginiamycin B lyase